MLVEPQDYLELSPYARFIIDNRGFEFYRKSDNKKLDKWEIFSIFEKSQKGLTEVCLNKHKIYGRRIK
jgi:hypothetical protein